MYYEFKRFVKKREAQEPFSGWALTRNGVIIETSNALDKFVGKKIEELISFATAVKIEWVVLEKKP